MALNRYLQRDINSMITGILWSVVLTLHLLCMAYWVGGGMAVWRSDKIADRSLSGIQGLSLRFQIYSRYYRALWHVIPLSAITGAALLEHIGPHAPVTYHMMMLCWMIMAGLFCWAYFLPLRELRRALRMQAKPLTLIRNITLLMMIIGILASLLGAFREFI